MAYYYNAGDLGLGREMHCKKAGADAACYVTNYAQRDSTGQPILNGDSQLAVTNAINHNDPVATVAMEYHAGTAPGENVQFFVYDGLGNLAKAALLDNQGLKFIPQLCLNCHGGAYGSPQSNVVLNASFLPFDVFSFYYADPASSASAPSGFSRDDQKEAFRQLNELVRATNPAPGIVDLIDGMYHGQVSVPNTTPDRDYIPLGWQVSIRAKEIYSRVVAPSCRTCHIAQRVLDWTTLNQMKQYSALIQYQVCVSHDMPHAEVTYNNFWDTRKAQFLSDNLFLDRPPCPSDEPPKQPASECDEIVNNVGLLSIILGLEQASLATAREYQEADIRSSIQETQKSIDDFKQRAASLGCILPS